MPRPAKRRRVVITGLGVVAPNGIGKDAFWEKLVAGESAVDRITAFDASSYKTQIAAEVKNFDPTRYISSKRARQMWRFSQFAVASAVLAVQDARLDLSASGLAARTAVCFGTSVGGIGTAESLHTDFVSNGPSRSLMQMPFDCPPHACANYVSLELGVTGKALSISSNCCTGLDVIQAAHQDIEGGISDLVIAGSAEAPIFPMTFAAFSELGVLSTQNNEPLKASRPFDLLRDGIVLGEGAGCVVLETAESAVARGAPIYAEVTGYGNAVAPMDIRRTDTTGVAMSSAISRALTSAGVLPSDIDYINAHGNSLRDHDLCDTNAFKAIFSEHAYNIPITSIKSSLGQAISASGVLQVVASCLTLTTGIAPPTINQDVPDPACDLDYVPNRARSCRARHVLVNAHAMGGSLAALVLSRAGTELL